MRLEDDIRIDDEQTSQNQQSILTEEDQSKTTKSANISQHDAHGDSKVLSSTFKTKKAAESPAQRTLNSIVQTNPSKDKEIVDTSGDEQESSDEFEAKFKKDTRSKMNAFQAECADLDEKFTG